MSRHPPRVSSQEQAAFRLAFLRVCATYSLSQASQAQAWESAHHGNGVLCKRTSAIYRDIARSFG